MLCVVLFCIGLIDYGGGVCVHVCFNLCVVLVSGFVLMSLVLLNVVCFMRLDVVCFVRQDVVCFVRQNVVCCVVVWGV